MAQSRQQLALERRGFANAGEFQAEAVQLDWQPDSENTNRKPSGQSVFDAESITDPENGRTYNGWKEDQVSDDHRVFSYFLPNDEAEQDRLDLQHELLTVLMHDKLYWAPIINPKYVLDIATGTGIWANQFGEQHPESQVIGTDLSKIQPTWVAPNVTFVQDDAEAEWIHGSGENLIKFDYIHLRWVFTCFSDPRKVMRQAFQNLAPGGWIEYCDGNTAMKSIDGSVEGTALKRWGDLFIEGMARNGRDLLIGRRYKQMLLEEGFLDVEERQLLLPGNGWPENARMKHVGRLMCLNAMKGFRGVGWKMFKSLGLTTDEIEKLVEDSKREAKDQNIRWYVVVYIVWGRKPFEHEMTSANPGMKSEV